MSVNVRRYRKGGWDVDIHVLLPNGKLHRERRKLRECSKTTAREWGEQRQRELLLSGLSKDSKEVQTLMEFASRFVETHAVANRQKPSEIAAKESILRVHLVPFLGRKRLDTISSEDVQELKRRLADRSPKTVNNILTVLSVLLKKAVEWGEIERVPCVIRHLPNPNRSAEFHDFTEYDR